MSRMRRESRGRELCKQVMGRRNATEKETTALADHANARCQSALQNTVIREGRRTHDRSALHVVQQTNPFVFFRKGEQGTCSHRRFSDLVRVLLDEGSSYKKCNLVMECPIPFID
jgi:hypothetical protein